MTTSVLSQPSLFAETELPLMSSAVGSRARTSHSLESDLASKVSALVSGATMHASLASYDPASSSWRTSQACLVSGWAEFSDTFPRSGMMRSGTVYQLPPSAPLTDGIGSGLLPTPTTLDWKDGTAESCANVPVNGLLGRAVHMWPTPRANDAEKRGDFDATNPRNGLAGAVKLWPTPHANCATGSGQSPNKQGGENLQTAVGGSLNPEFVEWLMGFPAEWTALDASETPSSRRFRTSSARPSLKDSANDHPHPDQELVPAEGKRLEAVEDREVEEEDVRQPC